MAEAQSPGDLTMDLTTDLENRSEMVRPRILTDERVITRRHQPRTRTCVRGCDREMR